MDYLLEPVFLAQVLSQGVVRGAMYALMASGLSLIFGLMGVKNFAHGELFMLGIYVMFFVTVSAGLPFPLGIAVAALALFAFGMVYERGLVAPLRRRAGRDWLLDAFVLTIGSMMVLRNMALILFGSERRGLDHLIAGTLEVGGVIVSYERIMIVLVAAGVGAALWAFLHYSPFGKAMRATGQDPHAAQSLGIDVARVYTYTFGLGAALAGIAGALMIPIYPAHPTVGFNPVIKSLASVILGGLGYVPGAIVAGLLIGIIEAFATFFLSAGWQNVVTAGLVITILIVRPTGLFGSGALDRA